MLLLTCEEKVCTALEQSRYTYTVSVLLLFFLVSILALWIAQNLSDALGSVTKRPILLPKEEHMKILCRVGE